MANLETALCPLPYHDALVDYLQTKEPETWAWFASTQSQAGFADTLRLDLLKQTYRLEATSNPDLFLAIDEAKQRLGLDVPVTIYQSQRNRDLNAALYYLPGEAHIVLEGAVLQLLDPRELRSVLGHELAHFVLWHGANQKYLVADRMTQAMANDPRGEPSHHHTARLMRLYTEIYADRGSLLVTSDPAPVISSLVKMQTGLAQVDPESYVRQADEVFAKAKVRTEELSHPEAFIRARAVMLWTKKAPSLDADLAHMIEGPVSLDKLDLVGQQRLTQQTRRWLQALLRPAWFQTDVVRAQARMLFDDFAFTSESLDDDALLTELEDIDPSVRDYLCYLLLDFAVADPELEEEPLKAAFGLAGRLGIDARLEALVVRELKMKKRDAQRIRAEAKGPAPTEDESANEGEPMG